MANLKMNGKFETDITSKEIENCKNDNNSNDSSSLNLNNSATGAYSNDQH